MKAILRLIPEDEKMEFIAEDFQLRFKVSHLLKKIVRVIEQERDGYFSLLFNDHMQEDIFLPDTMQYIRVEKDFSKYEIEVLTYG